MGASLLETKKRIITIESTEKISRAMKLVSTVKFQRWKKHYEDNKNYTDKMFDIFIKTYKAIDKKKIDISTYSQTFSDTKNLYVIVTTSLGLCGSYNYNVFRLIEKELKDDDELVIIGQKGLLHFRNFPNVIYDNYVNLYDNFSYKNVRMLRHFIFKIYRSFTFQSITLCYTKYINSISYIPVIEKLVPYDFLDKYVDEKDNSFSPIISPTPEIVSDLIFPHFADSILYNRLISSALSEHASRKAAMESASKNASKIVDELKLIYNKSRQEQITQEITEIASGANI